jgi:hypothetical protein
MNQRREPRFQADQQVRVTVYGPPDLHLTAIVKNVSGRGMGIEVDGPIATGTALKIDLDDAILLGEVIYARDQGTSFYLGVELEHALYGLAELAKAVRSFSVDAPDSSSQQPQSVEQAGDKHE